MEKIKIPAKCNTFQKKTQFFIKEIQGCLELINISENSATLQACRLGALFSALKKEVKKENQKWEKFLKKHFPHFGKKVRTAQRYRKLSKKVDLDKYPNLGFLGLTLLHTLVTLTGKKTVSAFLNDNDVKVDFDGEDKIDGFRCEVEELINSLKPKKTKKAKRAHNHEDEDDSVDAKSKPKAPSRSIVHDLDQTATTFIKSIELVIENEKAVKHNRKRINNIVKEVKAKLSILKEYQESVRDVKKSKKK